MQIQSPLPRRLPKEHHTTSRLITPQNHANHDYDSRPEELH